MTVAALALAPRNWRVAAGVLGGGVLIAVSYAAIASAVDALVGAAAASGGAAPAGGPPNMPWTLARLVLRYALLAVLAYVMIARLRLHPLGLLAGASSVVAAASVEALRLLLKK